MHDNVVVARVPIAKGTMLHPENIVVQSDIPLGHKLATCAIAKDEPVRKYNTIIGYATRDVVPGTHMHNDTIRFDRVEHPTDFCEDYHPVELLAPEQRRTFRGYVRPDGRVGTRNYIAIPVVSNCAATVARRIAAHFTPGHSAPIRMWTVLCRLSNAWLRYGEGNRPCHDVSAQSHRRPYPKSEYGRRACVRSGLREQQH